MLLYRYIVLFSLRVRLKSVCLIDLNQESLSSIFIFSSANLLLLFELYENRTQLLSLKQVLSFEHNFRNVKIRSHMLHGWRIGHSPEHKKDLQQKRSHPDGDNSFYYNCYLQKVFLLTNSWRAGTRRCCGYAPCSCGWCSSPPQDSCRKYTYAESTYGRGWSCPATGRRDE